MRLLLILLSALLAVPVATVLGAWAAFDEGAWQVLRHQASTVLPGYALQSLLLALGVSLGTAALGVGTAVAVALFRFPGRDTLEWALLLPMAMPAYVLAYTATDALQPSGAAQSALREMLGLRGALWPDVRSLGGAVVLFVLCLYPYVYLLTRAALGERAVQMMEAARLLGAGLPRRLWRVALPMARPAVVAGVALALMETLADYGVGAYFGLATLSTGIYRAWLSMNDANAAAQLASVLLAVVAALLVLERRAQSRLRFAAARSAAPHGAEAQPVTLRGLAAWAMAGACAAPVLLGFALPVSWLLAMLWREASYSEIGLQLGPFAQWAWASLRLAALAAVAATGLALALSFAQRQPSAGSAGPAAAGGLRPHAQRAMDAGLALGVRLVSLGYAVPGAVIAVGVLLPLSWVQQRWPQAGAAALFTGTVLGLLYAYLVRFCAVALQSIQSGYARVPISLDETARTLGAGRWRRFLRLHLPLLRRPVLGALLLVFVDVMKELPATLVLRPFGSDTLAVVAYNLARDERLAEAALPSLAIVAVGVLPVVWLSRAMNR